MSSQSLDQTPSVTSVTALAIVRSWVKFIHHVMVIIYVAKCSVVVLWGHQANGGENFILRADS